MKKIGFIDYYLHEWHANNYPQMISRQSGGELEVCYAWGEIDSPHKGADTNAAWAKCHNIALLSSIEEVVEKSDYLIVLSPDNPETHERLCEIPLASGKRTYVDKPFADDSITAKRLLERADRYNTPVYSCSALNFAQEYADVETRGVETVGTWGEGSFEVYSIHQIEPIVRIMGPGARRVMFMGSDQFPSLYIEYDGGRHAQAACYPRRTPFLTNIGYSDGTTRHIAVQTGYFEGFIQALIDFFKTGRIPVERAQTIEVIAIREAGLHAMNSPFTWIDIEQSH